ncbi:hypothetical protein JCGZ_22824 [Jatropha curcas]|uniref:TRF2/HOY1 PH-like domain-containing protein n=1 Tax=Jatropha curcas TaxID=180498 RepID=A0A067L4F3_JATCU|nr:hypothetical protein JCGZ_22824 [Jatropha curcas]
MEQLSISGNEPTKPEMTSLDENRALGAANVETVKDSLEENGSLNDNEQSKPSETFSKASGTAGKPRVSKISAFILRIGSWEHISRNEEELIAKCHFGYKELVWEVLEGGKRSKMIIEWRDIMALKASCPDNEPGTLTIVLKGYTIPKAYRVVTGTRFYKWTGKHTQGLLNEYFERLIQCDMHLKLLSRQPQIVLDSPYFEHLSSFSEDQDEAKGQDINQVETDKGSSISDFQDLASPSAARSSSLEIEKGDIAGK